MSSVVKAAGLILFRRKNSSSAAEFLLLKASYGERHWSPPKGHVDPGEDDMTAAVRETHEESGFPRNSYNLLDDFKIELNYEVHKRPKLVTYFLAELKDSESQVVLSEEHEDFVWMQVEDAMCRAGYEDMQKALQKANEYVTRSL